MLCYVWMVVYIINEIYFKREIVWYCFLYICIVFLFVELVKIGIFEYEGCECIYWFFCELVMGVGEYWLLFCVDYGC